jgi:DNA-binding beta-propeller fold protein YncE
MVLQKGREVMRKGMTIQTKNWLYFICLAFLFLLLNVTLVSCRKDKGAVNYGEFPADVGRIMGTTCAVSGCHNAASSPAAGHLNLESWVSMFRGSSSGSPVIPYSSKFSSLCYYINTYPELGLQAEPLMPLNGRALTFAQVKLIKDWIDAGAPDVKGKVMWADDPLRKKLYAVNQGCDVVTVFDSETQLPMRYIEVGRPGVNDTPHQVRVSPDGKFWYVIFINFNMMEKYRCSDDAFVGRIPLSPLAAGTSTLPTNDALNWNVFDISRDSKRAYCVSWTNNGHVAAVNLETEKLLHFTGGLSNPHAVVIHPDQTKIYVAAQTGNYITEIDTGFTFSNDFSLNGQAVSQLSSLDPHDMLLSADDANILITCQKSNEVRVFHLASGMVNAGPISTGYFPQEIVYARATNQYFVSCPYDVSVANSQGLIVRLDGNNLSNTAMVPCGYQPHGIAVDEKKKLLYVLSRNIQANGPAPHHSSICSGRNGFVNFIDLNTFKVQAKKYELSVDPYFIYARP